MSYDVFLTPNQSPPSPQGLLTWFSELANVTIIGGDTDHPQAEYNDPNTDVHMLFDIGTEPTDECGDGPENDAVAALTLNFIRPSTFGRVASDLLSQVMEQFDLSAYDPQAEMTWPRPLDCVSFHATYSDHAARAAKAAVSHHPEIELITAPSELLDAVFLWNSTKENRMRDATNEHFIPQLRFYDDNGTAKTFFVWGDAVITQSPRVDSVLMLRKELSPPKGLFRGKTTNADILTWDEYQTLCGSGLVQSQAGEFQHDWGQQEFIENRVRSWTTRKSKPLESLASPSFTPVAFSSVVDEEFFA